VSSLQSTPFWSVTFVAIRLLQRTIPVLSSLFDFVVSLPFCPWRYFSLFFSLPELDSPSFVCFFTSRLGSFVVFYHQIFFFGVLFPPGRSPYPDKIAPDGARMLLLSSRTFLYNQGVGSSPAFPSLDFRWFYPPYFFPRVLWTFEPEFAFLILLSLLICVFFP